jgi:adenylate cyclase
MIAVAEELLDKITETIHYLRTGKVPPSIPIPDDLPDNEMRQLLTYVNRFLVEFAAFTTSLEQIAQGELETRPLLGRMAAVQAFKALRSNLKHLTWKTQQVASGDLEQEVDFMGDFSIAFNTMTRQLKDSRDQLVDLNKELERRNKFIRETFGRYTSEDIVEVLLDLPEGLKLGGEKRQVTLMMSDLRGFTALAERFEPTVVMALLNHYLSAMIEIIHKHGGTIDDIIGDAILVIFGAPLAMPDAAQRAVLGALEMQKAMKSVNEHNLRMAWPEIEMGIALHTGEAVIGNIGSMKRSKYGVVGQLVNLTARIESFTVGGQVLVSPTLINAADHELILGDEITVHGKGMRKALKCRDLLGHADYPDLMLEEEKTILRTLPRPWPVWYLVLSGKHLDGPMQPATLVSISPRRAVVAVDRQLLPRDNIMLRLEAGSGEKDSPEVYAKVLQSLDASMHHYLIHFTFVPPAVQERLQLLVAGDKGP